MAASRTRCCVSGGTRLEAGLSLRMTLTVVLERPHRRAPSMMVGRLATVERMLESMGLRRAHSKIGSPDLQNRFFIMVTGKSCCQGNSTEIGQELRFRACKRFGWMAMLVNRFCSSVDGGHSDESDPHPRRDGATVRAVRL